MADNEHPFDSVADDLLAWMNEEVDYHVETLRGGYRAPFSAQVSEKDKHDYYARQMFQAGPNGVVDYAKPNPEGRDKLLKSLGVTGYTQVMQAVMPPKSAKPAAPEPEAPADPLEATMPPMPEDTEPV